MSKQHNIMKWILFSVFIIQFALLSLGTLAMIFLDFGSPTPDERSLMSRLFIGEVAASILALFYSFFGMKPQGNVDSFLVEQLRDDLRAEPIESDDTRRSHSYESGGVISNTVESSTAQHSASVDDEALRILDSYTIEPPFSITEYKLAPLPVEIDDDIRNSKPFDRDYKENLYRGIKVQWKVILKSIYHGNDGKQYTIAVSSSARMLSIDFNVSADEVQQFKVLDEGTVFWIAGEVSEAYLGRISLINVVLKSTKNKG